MLEVSTNKGGGVSEGGGGGEGEGTMVEEDVCSYSESNRMTLADDEVEEECGDGVGEEE